MVEAAATLVATELAGLAEWEGTAEVGLAMVAAVVEALVAMEQGEWAVAGAEATVAIEQEEWAMAAEVAMELAELAELAERAEWAEWAERAEWAEWAEWAVAMAVARELAELAGGEVGVAAETT